MRKMVTIDDQISDHNEEAARFLDWARGYRQELDDLRQRDPDEYAAGHVYHEREICTLVWLARLSNRAALALRRQPRQAVLL